MKDIIFENVEKTYGKNVIVENLNIKIHEGERIILLGPSGCGKSTTLRIIAGLENITNGNLYMSGQKVNEIPSGERNVSMVFQNYALYPHMTVEENITYALRVHKMDPAEVKSRMNSVIGMLDLKGLEKRKPKDLSGGQRQRVALARAAVKRSDYFLLDEPLSNLDAQLRVHARKELVKIHELYRQTLVYVTHDQIEAMTVGHRIALMYQGRLQMLDTPFHVYNRPANVFTAKFIGSPSTNIVEAHYADGELMISGEKIALPEIWNKKIAEHKKSRYYFGIRPEHVVLSRERKENAFKGIVKYTEDYGDKAGVYFEINGAEMIAICEGNVPLSGEEVYFEPNYSKIHLFDFETTESIGYPEGL